MDLLFPELQYFFKSGIHVKACYELLKTEPNPDKMRKCISQSLRTFSTGPPRDTLTKVLSNAVLLKELASQSVGIKNDTISLQIFQAISQIELFTQQLNEIDESINSIMDKLDSVIKTIPCIGSLNGAMIIGETGDISRFKKPCQLLAYAVSLYLYLFFV